MTFPIKKQYMIGPYMLYSVLTETDHALLYEATETMFCNKLVIKCIKKSAASEEQIQNEVNIMRSLDHPNILHVIDVYDLPDYYCVILPLAAGGDLFELVFRQKLEELCVCKIMYSLFNAVKYCHSVGIVHNDIKPENIFLENGDLTEPKVLLADFGYALRMKPGELLNEFNGTTLYAPPEMIMGRLHNEKVDMWSLGVTMYYLLSRCSPFPPEECVPYIVKANYNLDIKELDGVSSEAKDLIRRLMEIDPKRRISAEEALSHEWFQSYLPESERPQTSPLPGTVSADRALEDAANQDDSINDAY